MNCLKKIVSSLLVGAMLFSSAALAASGQHEVTADKLYFRSGASGSSKPIATLNRGTVVTVLSSSEDWAKARWNGEVGYLSMEYLDKISSASTNGSNTTKLSGSGYASGSTHLYKSADNASEKLASIEQGTKLTICGETMNFYYVKANGKYGYIAKGRVSFDEVKGRTSNNSSNSAAASNLLEVGCEGDSVKQLQKRLSELGYMSDRYITGYFGEITESAVLSFQTVNSLDVDGVVGPATRSKLNSSGAKKQPKVVEMDWYDSNVASLVSRRGGTAKIIDCRTGTVINIRRVGGYNHMDIEPLDKEDTKKLSKIYGGSWSWGRRPVILVAGGKYIAASINGMPHGSEISTSNNFEGQFCLHTTNSRTHGTDRVDEDHQRCINEAMHYGF